MSVEKFTFIAENKFDYHIQVDESIDQENTKVQPLIPQQFFENSICHDIVPKRGTCNIDFNIQQEDDMLNFVVDDDSVE